ncbi:MAG: hypothetical protein H0Z39_02185 [Peptococcaceae bacterium]|nr:hypothetical protein [Peptococcaceae bacterium]
MLLKQAVMQFHYGETVKSFLIAAAGLLAELAQLSSNESSTALRLCKNYLAHVKAEIRLAASVGGLSNLSEVEQKLKEAIWEAHINRPAEAGRLLGEAISLVVTATEKAALRLKSENIL